MEERLTKIAEASFRKAMAKFSSWGDIGIALKNVQSEIREVSKRTRTVEHVLGHPWNYGQNAKQSADKTSSEIRHLSGEQVKQIRLKKKLKISHIAQLLNVSIRKYTEWERGISLMAPWVEDEILRLSKIKGRDLQAPFKKEENTAPVESRPPKPKQKTPPKVSRDELKHVCKVFQLSQRQLAEKLGTKYHTVSNWIRRGIRPANEIIERFLVLLSEAKKINPEIAIEPPSAVTVKNKQIAEEIRQILNYLHWTHRELAQHVHAKPHLVWYWINGHSAPNPKVMEKIQQLQKSIQTGEIAPEYEGELATSEDFFMLRRNLNRTINWMARELHMTVIRLQALESGHKDITYHDTIKIRNLQRKVAMGEITPVVDLPNFPVKLIKELCRLYRFSMSDLSAYLGCDPNSIGNWIRGHRGPCKLFNQKLWELWNNAPKEIVPELTPDEVYKFRRKLNMTQIEFGVMLHVKNVTVSHWERGHSFPGLKRCDEIRAICMKKISELEDKRKIDTDMEEL